MRLNVTFRCSLPVEQTAYPVGEELAEYLRSQLLEAGIPIQNVETFRDFAWAINVTMEGKSLFLCVGYVGDGDYEWLLQIHEHKHGFWSVFRKKVALEEMAKLAPCIHAVLEADSRFSEIRWHVGDFAEERFSATPDETSHATCEPAKRRV